MHTCVFSFAIYTLFAASSFVCFVLQSVYALPMVLAAALPALIATFIPFPKRLTHHPYAAIYSGCFAGMCSVQVVTEYWQLAVIALFGSVLYIKSINLFEGFGGRLGGIAFTCVALFVLIKGMI